MKRTDNLSLPVYEVGDKFYAGDFNDTNNKVDKAISDLQETINYAKGDGVAITSEVIQARGVEMSLKEKLNSIEAMIPAPFDPTSINTSITQINNTISPIKTDVSTLKTDVSTAKGNITTINTNISTLQSKVAREYYVDDFTGSTDTAKLENAIATVPSGSVIKFHTSKKYTIGSISRLTKGLIIDFMGAEVELNSSGVIFEIGHPGEHFPRNKFLNCNFVKHSTAVPTKVFYINDGINTEIDGKFSQVNASHSVIHNYKGYGTKIRGEYRWSVAPAVIYLSNNGLDIHSYAVDINVDITGNQNGVGIDMEGGNGWIKGVIESCKIGFRFNGQQVISALNMNVYFENNSSSDMYLTDSTGSQANIKLDSCFFTRAGLTNAKAIELGRRITLTVENCFFNAAGIYEITTGVSAASKVVGINNAVITGGHADFATYRSILSDSIYLNTPKCLMEGEIKISPQAIEPNTTAITNLGTQAKNFKDIWLSGVLYLPTYSSTNRPTPLKGGATIFDATLNKPIHYYSGKWYDAVGTEV